MQLDRARFQLAEHRFAVHEAIVPENTTREEVESPEFFSQVSGLCRRGDEIRIVWEQEHRMLRAYVLVSERNFVRIKVFEDYSLVDDKPFVLQKAGSEYSYKSEWAGRHHRWRAVRKKDKEVTVLKAGFETKEQADNWLKEYLKAEAA